MIWAGSLGIIKRIRATLRDFMWCGSDHNCRVKVGWYDCCASRKVGSLNILDLEEALMALIAKWLLKALALGTSNIQHLLHYKLMQIQPAGRGTWPRSPQ
jgi:hypothetical protein